MRAERREIQRVIRDITPDHTASDATGMIAGLRGIHDVVLDLRKQLKEEVRERKRYKKERDDWKQKCKVIKEEVISKKDTEKQPDTNLEEERKQLEQNLQKETERCKELEERLNAMRSPEFVDQCRVDKARYQFMERVMQQLYGEDVIKKNFNIESIDFGEQIPQEWIDDTSDAGLVRWIKRHTKKSILDAIGDKSTTFTDLLHEILNQVSVRRHQREQDNSIELLRRTWRCKAKLASKFYIENFTTKINEISENMNRNITPYCSENQRTSNRVFLNGLIFVIKNSNHNNIFTPVLEPLQDVCNKTSNVGGTENPDKSKTQTEYDTLSQTSMNLLFVEIIEMILAARRASLIHLPSQIIEMLREDIKKLPPDRQEEYRKKLSEVFTSTKKAGK